MKDIEKNDEFFMKNALKQAKKAFNNEDVPVGAVVVCDEKIVGCGYNKKEKTKCSLYHAEIEAIKKACKNVGDWRLCDCTLYVTLEPCVMCAGAIMNHRIKRVVIGVTEPNFGACGSGIDILNNEKLNTKTEVITGILKDECLNMLQTFFKNRREFNKSGKSDI